MVEKEKNEGMTIVVHPEGAWFLLTSHKLLQHYWHDDRYDTGKVHVWYTDRGAQNDRSGASGHDIVLEPYYMSVRTDDGAKPVPYHRILLITYDEEVTFENRKIRGLAGHIIQENRHTA
jgi:uncharacterized protein (UPF0248 family)